MFLDSILIFKWLLAYSCSVIESRAIELPTTHLKIIQTGLSTGTWQKVKCYTTNINTTLIRWFCFKIEKDNIFFYQLRSDMQTPSQLWFTFFKLDGLRKLFENTSARDIYWTLFDIKNKITNNVNCITLHWMYILANIKTIPGILVNLIVTVNSKYTFFVQNKYLVELNYTTLPSISAEISVFLELCVINNPSSSDDPSSF